MNPVREALKDLLSGDSELAALATGGIHHRIADGDAPPYVIFYKMSGVPSYAFYGPPMDWDIWCVKGIGKAAKAEAIAARCDELLQDANLTIDGREHQYLRRESDVDYGEVVNGERFDHVGALYRLVSEASS